jgi:hypothetical protein
MYQQLEPHAKALNNLPKTLAAPNSAALIDALSAALAATAQKMGAMSKTQGMNRTTASDLTKLRDGFLAASRVVVRLHEQKGA